jgi:hypothetical protein
MTRGIVRCEHAVVFALKHADDEEKDAAAKLHTMPTRSYEFTSFRSTLDAQHNSPRVTPSKATPWVPGGVSKQHAHARGLPLKQEEAVKAVEAAAKAAAAEERAATEARLDATVAVFDRFDARLEKVVSAVEEHMIGATAANVLIAKRLRQLGL